MHIRKILRITLLALLFVVVYFGISTAIYFYSNRDTNNAKVEGFVYSKTSNKPVVGATVSIISERYESDSGVMDYDEYRGSDTIIIETNEKGYFSTIIPASAYLHIKTKGTGYLTEVKNQYTEKNNFFEVYLEND